MRPSVSAPRAPLKNRPLARPERANRLLKMCTVEESRAVEASPGAPLSRVDLTALCCPYADHGDLKLHAGAEIVCESCGRSFRSIEGRPILFDETRSIF